MNYWTQSNENIYVAAHRGWSAKYPENTMAAYKVDDVNAFAKFVK